MVHRAVGDETKTTNGAASVESVQWKFNASSGYFFNFGLEMEIANCFCCCVTEGF